MLPVRQAGATAGFAGHRRYKVRYTIISNQLNPKADPNQPLIYQIRLKGHLGQQWAASFAGLTLTLEANGDTLLTGPVVDQAALHGLLRKVRDLGILLISGTHIHAGQASTSDFKP